MDKIELICKIGNEICEDCGPHRDCGLDLDDCDRIDSAILWLNKYLEKVAVGG